MPTLPAFPSRRSGRPRNPEQEMPSAVSPPLARTRVTLAIPSCTLLDLNEYANWLAALVGMPEEEARVTAVDAAIRRLIKTDPLWKKKVRAERAARSAPAQAAAGGSVAQVVTAPAADADPLGLDAPTVITAIRR